MFSQSVVLVCCCGIKYPNSDYKHFLYDNVWHHKMHYMHQPLPYIYIYIHIYIYIYIHLYNWLFLWRRHKRISSCTGGKVNAIYGKVPSRIGVWFKSITSESLRHFSPPTAMASVLTFRPCPISHNGLRLKHWSQLCIYCTGSLPTCKAAYHFVLYGGKCTFQTPGNKWKFPNPIHQSLKSKPIKWTAFQCN